MAVLKMRRINICAMKKYEKPMLEYLQRMGAMEIEQCEDEARCDFISRTDTSAKRAAAEENIRLSERAVEILDEYLPEKNGIGTVLKGRKRVRRQDFDILMKIADKVMRECAEIQELREKIQTEEQLEQNIKAKMTAVEPWLNCSCSMGITGTKTTDIIFGTLPVSAADETLSEIFADKAAYVSVISEDKNLRYIAVISAKSVTNEISQKLRDLGFAHPAVKIPGVPSEYNEELKKQLDNAAAEKDRLIKEIQIKVFLKDYIKETADYYRILSERYIAEGKLMRAKRTFFITGYIPEKYAEEITLILAEKYGAASETEEDAKCPTKLENAAFAASFEPVLESYGLPRKHDIDPSFIMGVFYVFLFGLMLSDAAYGLIITTVCAVLLKKFKTMEDGMRKSLRMFMYCGISTMFWGVMFGGYFGDAVNAAAKTFFNKDIEIPALWFVPIKDPMKLLLYSMLFGLIHLFAGLGIKGYMCIRDGDLEGFVCDVLSWFLLIIGLLLIFLQSPIYASLAGAVINIGHIGDIAAKIIAFAGAVIILFSAGRESKNVGKRLAKGLYSLYGITSWLSDLLSYSRLLALGLATGVIAQVVNSMGTMAGNGIAGAAVFAVVFVIGHAFNLSINLLGAYVHTNRLQYVEFFGKFYEGGAEKFNPFAENTKNIKIL